MQVCVCVCFWFCVWVFVLFVGWMGTETDQDRTESNRNQWEPKPIKSTCGQTDTRAAERKVPAVRDGTTWGQKKATAETDYYTREIRGNLAQIVVFIFLMFHVSHQHILELSCGSCTRVPADGNEEVINLYHASANGWPLLCECQLMADKVLVKLYNRRLLVQIKNLGLTCANWWAQTTFFFTFHFLFFTPLCRDDAFFSLPTLFSSLRCADVG